MKKKNKRGGEKMAGRTNSQFSRGVRDLFHEQSLLMGKLSDQKFCKKTESRESGKTDTIREIDDLVFSSGEFVKRAEKQKKKKAPKGW